MSTKSTRLPSVEIAEKVGFNKTKEYEVLIVVFIIMFVFSAVFGSSGDGQIFNNYLAQL